MQGFATVTAAPKKDRIVRILVGMVAMALACACSPAQIGEGSPEADGGTATGGSGGQFSNGTGGLSSGGSGTSESMACVPPCAGGAVCSDGICLAACPPDRDQCGSNCIDTNGDAANCGACGTGCEAGEACVGGSCACQAPRTACSDGCFDTSIDPDHCGSCTTVCPADQVCSSSACASTCAPGQMLCGRSCVDITSDPSHCGRCDSACGPTETCNGGSCGCAGGGTECNGGCVDTTINAAHCGACNAPCPEGQVCVGSTCGCADGQKLCGTTCVDTNANDANCGDCGISCGAGEACAGGTCVGGVLELSAVAANTTVGLEWPRVPNATTYRVYYATSPGVTTSAASFTDTEPATVHRGLENGTTYYYRVSATTAAGEGPLSNEVSAVPTGEWVLEALGAGDFDDVATGNRVPRIPIERRVHVFLLPEGYLADELSTFHSIESHEGERRSDVDRWMDEVFAIDPYAQLKEAFVIWYLPRASQSHVGGGPTAFNITITSGGVTGASNAAAALWSAIDGQGSDAFPYPPGVPVTNHVASFMIYDSQNRRAGFSGVATQLTNPSNNQQRIRSAFARGHAHEFTHAFSNLRDEYLEDNNTIREYSETSNVTPSNQCSELPWAHLLDGAGINETPGLVGAFGRPERGYRSELKCLMNGSHENGKYYCGSEQVSLNLRSDGRLCNFCREITAYRVFDRTGLLSGGSGFDSWKSTHRPAFFERFGFSVPTPVPQTLTCPSSSPTAPDEPCVP